MTRVVPSHVSGRIDVSTRVEGAADMKADFMEHDISPNHLSISYMLNIDTGEWEFSSWTVRGPRRLKGGGLSDRLTHKVQDWNGKRTPPWIEAAIKHFTPGRSGLPTMDTWND